MCILSPQLQTQTRQCCRPPQAGGSSNLGSGYLCSALVVLLVLMVFRALLPWVLVALVGWWVWKAVSK